MSPRATFTKFTTFATFATFTTRGVTLRCVVFASLILSVPAFGQSGDRKPPPTAKDQARTDDRSGQPRTAKPDAKEKRRGDERIRLDAPVSFPVDI
jgi:hypothetical protein